jgi:hypothetical protein
MRLFLLVLFLIHLCYCEQAAAQEYQLVASFEIVDTSFTTDPLGRIYTYNTAGDMTRYSPAGKVEQEFSVYDRGKVGYIDTTDPLQILMFYPDYGDVSILDAGFSENVTFTMAGAGYPMSELICVSPREGYWLYDPGQRKLIKLNEQLNVVAEGTFLDRVETVEHDPKGLVDSGNWVVMWVPGLGLMVFDQYGTYFKTIRMHGIRSYQVFGGRILVFDGSSIKRIGISDGIVEKMVLPEGVEPEGIRLVEGRIVIRSGNTIKVFSYR